MNTAQFITVDGSGNVFVSDQSYLWEIQGAGGDAVILGNVQSPEGMVADSRGNVFVANGAAKVIDKLNLITAKFGAVNVGSTGSAVTLTFTFIHGGAISAPMVVTKGAVDLDFVDAGTGTCTTNNGSDKIYETGETCTVDVTLEPTVSGVRVGAVELLDIDGNVISTAYLQGTGVGPQVAFSPATRSMVATGLGSPSAVAVDGDGNIFATQAFSSVKKFAPGGAVTTLTGVPGSADGVAVDGAGNLFVALPNSKAVYEVLAVGGYTTVKQLGVGFVFGYPYGVAVDGAGNAFVVDASNNAVYEIEAAGGYATVKTLATSFNQPYGIAADVAGNVFVADTNNNAVKEILVAGGYTTVKTLAGSYSTVRGVAVDGNGNVFVADAGHQEVKEILVAGGYTTANTVASGIGQDNNIAVDALGNIYVVLPYVATPGVMKLDVADGPTIVFAGAAVGSTITDGSKTVTVENIGNAPLSFPAPSSGTNPSIAAGFTLISGNGSDCQLISAGASAGTLEAGSSCQLPIGFAPTQAASYNGTLVLTDDALNAVSPAYATQSIALSGLGMATQAIVFTLPGTAIYNGVNLTFTPSASGGGSGNPVVFSVDPSSTAGIASISGGTLTIIGPGTVIIDANQAGNANYVAAPQVQRTMVVSLDSAVGLDALADDQSARVGQLFGDRLWVKAVDGGGNGVWGVTVTFTIPTSGASAVLSSMTAVTDLNGTASVSATANMIPGAYQVSAMFPGATLGALFNLTNLPPPVFTVTTLTDDVAFIPTPDGSAVVKSAKGVTSATSADGKVGVAANCNDTSTGATAKPTCSLRDAIAAATEMSTATLTPTINFAASLNLSASHPGVYNVDTGGSLEIGANMDIVGPGANALSVASANLNRIFYIDGETTVAISGLTVTGGKYKEGSGIKNFGTLTLANCTISNNVATNWSGGGIHNVGMLTMTDCTVSGNSAGNNGGGIVNYGPLTVTSSTFSGNSATTGGGIYNYSDNDGYYGAAVVSNSTFSGNSAVDMGGGLYNTGDGATMTLVNDTISGNSAGSETTAGGYSDAALTLANNLLADAIDNGDGTETDNGGNVVVGSGTPGVTLADVNLAPLGNYGGPTQTMMPLLSSVAICAGIPANATTAGLSTDQRGNPRSTTAYSPTACVDAGSVQTAYSLSFTTSPASSQHINVAFTPDSVVQLSDNAQPFALPGAPITVALKNGALSGTLRMNTGTNGAAIFSGLKVSGAQTGDYLVASATAGPFTITANSTSFDVIAITLTPPPLAAGQVGVSYAQQILASGGTSPYAYSVTGGSWPAGLTLAGSGANAGLISGIPTAAGTFNFTIQATDSANNTASQAYSIVVSAPVLALAPATLPAGTFGSVYSRSISASGGTAPYTYSVGAGLPPGLLLSASTGLISGTPTAASATPYSFTVTATDSSTGTGAPFSVSQVYAITVNRAASAVKVTSSANPVFVQNAVTFTATVALSASQPTGSGSGVQPMGSAPGLSGPTGTVTFLDGTTPLGTGTLNASGVATFTTSNLAVASHSITASYGGDANYLPGPSSVLTEAVVDFTITIQGASFTVIPGSTATYAFLVSPSGGATLFPSAITMSVSGLPAGTTAVFTPSTIAAGAGVTTVTLTVQTTKATAAIEPPSGPGGNLLSRLAPFSLAFFLLPFVGRLRKAGRRFSRMLSIFLLLVAGAVALAGVSGCGSATGFFGQAQQTYTLTATGTSGALSHTSNVTLTIE